MHGFRTGCLAAALALAAALPARAQFGGGGLGMGGLGGGLGGGQQGGVFLDAEGVVRTLKKAPKGMKVPKATAPKLPAELAAKASLRRVSLKALDAAVRQELLAGGLSEPSRRLAGLHRIDYLVLDRARKDIVLCGPAEGWTDEPDGRALGKESRRPALEVADVAAAFRCVLRGDGVVRCSIDPRKDGIRQALAYEMPAVTGEKGQAEQIRQELEDLLGLQDVTTGGVPPGSRFARAMVDADYRMKRLAMGLDKAPGLYTHLDAVLDSVRATGHGPATIARWWFEADYTGVSSDDAGTVFRLEGPGMRLLNEDMRVGADGARSGTGRSGAAWDKFSQAFTKLLPAMEPRAPAFADLHNLFDLAMFAAVVKQQGAGDWLEGTVFLDERVFPIPEAPAPKHAEPVVTTKLGRSGSKHQLGIAFGGVAMTPSATVGKPGFVKSGTLSGVPSAGGSTGAKGGGEGVTVVDGGAAKPGKGTAGAAAPAPSADVLAKPLAAGRWWSD